MEFSLFTLTELFSYLFKTLLWSALFSFISFNITLFFSIHLLYSKHISFLSPLEARKSSLPGGFVYPVPSALSTLVPSAITYKPNFSSGQSLSSLSSCTVFMLGSRTKGVCNTVARGFPSDSAGKQSTCNAGDLGLIPGLGRSP